MPKLKYFFFRGAEEILLDSSTKNRYGSSDHVVCPPWRPQIDSRLIMDDRSMNVSHTKLLSFFFGWNSAGWLGLLVAICATPRLAAAQEPNYIWSAQMAEVAPGDSRGECYYRKKFTLVKPESATLEFSAGDEYEIYINGQLASRGQSYGSTATLDVAKYLASGINLVAVKVRHLGGDNLGLKAKLRIRESGETRWRSLITDDSWKTRTKAVTDWQKSSHNDLSWLKSQSVVETKFGTILNQAAKQPAVLQTSANQDSTPKVMQADGLTNLIDEKNASRITTLPHATQSTNEQRLRQKNDSGKPNDSSDSPNSRFQIDPEFEVQMLLTPEETGSLIAMEFNEFGDLLLSREGGPLLIADPSKPQNDPARIRTYCDTVTSCQGILPLNGSVYVTGNGPDGLGLYRLTDTNRNGTAETVKKLLSFTGEIGEHGPHGIQLGPDGMIYIIVGNGSQLIEPVADTSPYSNSFEGNLIPRFEDPGGHAAGIKAPGGTVIRLSVDGSKIERVAGGIRNAYDLVFDDRGELFIHDSDMESDEGTTWYRPTTVFHVADGADFGWRSGWSKFPQHFIDQSPAVCETGRGSPTGAVFYQHLQFPVRYQNTIFLADWSEGRILALRKLQSGAGYVAEPEVFLKGRPLNVCDLAIAEDGALYFCTGGRGTSGGVFRIRWKGEIPDQMLAFESDLAKIIRHPQPQSAWARQSIAELQKTMGSNWQNSIEGVAAESRNPAKFRLRALQLMVLYGPTPSDALLAKLATDPSTDIRAQVARLCGLNGGEQATTILKRLLSDSHSVVRRATCESFLRMGTEPDFESLQPLLSSLDRVEALAARRLLERMPVETYANEVIASEDIRVFIQGSLAMMTAAPTLERAYQILARCSNLMEGFLNDQDFIDLLRLMEITLVKGEVVPARVPGLALRIANEFPSASSSINQELARLLAYLEVGNLDGRLIEYLKSDDQPLPDRVHVAMHLQSVGKKLTDGNRMAIIDCLETARTATDVGGSYALYLKKAVEDTAKTLTPEQLVQVLASGSRWPNAALAAFYQLPEKLDQETVETIVSLDQSLIGVDDPASEQLRLGVIALLARSQEATSMKYLRELWQKEERRRNDIVIGLAQQPDGENWPYLVSSLPILDDLTGQEVVQKLADIPRLPRDPQHFRDVIELGFRMRNIGGSDAVKLMEFWSQEKLSYSANDWETQLRTWQSWFQQKWPEQSPIVAGQTQKTGRYSVDELLSYIEENGLGDAQRGRHFFTTAQCAACHQLGSAGQNVGPDLTSLGFRFSLRETLEATIQPSKTIPDRYQSKIVLTVDGQQFSGMAVSQSDGGFVILQSNGKRVRIAGGDVEEVKTSNLSAMPEGLLDQLSPPEIADLMAFIMQAQPAENQSAKSSTTTQTR